jgi:diguanylate cyclase (GGDEF)-like protein
MNNRRKENENTLLGNIMRIVVFSLALFFLFAILYLLVVTMIRINLDKISKEKIINSEEMLVDVEKDILTNRIERLTSDVLYIADTYELYGEDEQEHQTLENQWISFSNRKAIYDQIRFIDVDGNEIVRVNYSEDGTYAVEENSLQNKADRYYYLESIALQKGQIYISELDLNVENCVVEDPIKPTIRLSTPVFNSKNELMGIIVLNYLAEDMLDQMRKIAITSQGYIFLINEEGYWLYNGENAEKEWGFMYEERMEESFQTFYQAEWKEIEEQREGIISSNQGVFCYTSMLSSEDLYVEELQQPIVSSEGIWYLASYIPPDSEAGLLFSKSILKTTWNIIKENWLILLMLAIFSNIIVVLISINKIEKNKIKYYSEYDAMTGVYNRRAGFERLNAIYKEATKKNSKFSLCFIDINGLKEVNDGLGHDVGDELITSIIQIIKENMRATDFIARFGGDEFLIAFIDMNEQESEHVWERIETEFKRINDTEERKYIISVSHGVEEFKFNATEYIDSIINVADEKMYQEKRIIKQNLKVLR